MPTLVVAMAMALSVIGEAGAAPGQSVPQRPQVTDARGDANYVEQAAIGNVVPEADILSVWFTNTRKLLRVHIQTSAPPPHAISALAYRIRANPTEDTSECLWFEGYVRASSSNVPYPVSEATLISNCEDYPDIRGDIATQGGPEGTGITTMTFLLGSHPALARGKNLTSPNATSSHLFGRLLFGGGQIFTAPAIDNTDVGSSYRIR